VRGAAAVRRLGGALVLAGATLGAAASGTGSGPSAPVASAVGTTAAGGPVYHDMVAVVHLHTTVADGASSPLQMARAARAAGIDAIVVTDHFLERVTYAPWPVGGVIGVTLSRPSVVRYGLRRYLRDLAAAEAAVPGMIVVPGLEVTPYDHFAGSFLADDLELRGWHRHMLIVGLDDARLLARLPVAGNRWGGVYGAGSLLFLLPLGGLAWAVPRVRRPGYRDRRVGEFRLRRRRRPVGEIVTVAASLALLYAGFPYRVERFSPVGRDPGTAPYRELVDAVRGWGGLTAWAHPEARAIREEHWGVRLITEPYPELIAQAPADEFGALPEGTEKIIPPGALWDRALLAGLDGPRPGAPHAWAEVDEHRSVAVIDFNLLQTVFQVRDRSRAGLLEALRAGRHYARWTPPSGTPLSLRTWSVTSGDRMALAGGMLRARGTATVRFDVQGGGGPVKVRLVRAGEVIWSAAGTPPLSGTLQDNPPRSTYYRLDVEGAYPYRLLSNPIVLRRPGGAA
jgi:hypothetical protein